MQENTKYRGAVTPKWFQNACGMLLTYLLMKPDGFLNLIQGVINIGQDAKGSKSNDDKKRYTIIATVVSNPIFPDSKYQDLDKFYECVCAQVLSLLKRSQVKSVFIYLYNPFTRMCISLIIYMIYIRVIIL